MSTGAPIDAAVRERALNPAQSFIVQAPAGSGKTELLTRRVLTLLTLVDEPEQVLAITFTRKAASEMRSRVVELLQQASSGAKAENAYEQTGLELAQSVLSRDAQLNWQLLENPQRLNMRTIDALCTNLAHRLPVVSQLGAPTGLADNAKPLYRLAAMNLLDAQANSLDKVLLHLGNRQEQVQTLLAELLANRDQWLRYIFSGVETDELRFILESMLQRLVESRLAALLEQVPVSLQKQLPELLCGAAKVTASLAAEDAKVSAPAPELLSINGLPDANHTSLPVWEAIADIVLVARSSASAKARKTVTRAQGFATSAADAKIVGESVEQLKQRKSLMVELLANVAEFPELLALLDEVRRLPHAGYTDNDWQILEQLLTVLPNLLAELQWVFAQQGQVDFTEMALRAQRALGTEEEPTDLALAMDLSIKHVLVDEFQDTSKTQFDLYKKLLAGWEPDDGRTFFAVGDPMQSIYRFREGDVTLFSQAAEQGIANVYLEPLHLSVNFRAAPDIVSWVNDSFTAVFPAQSDDITGAVPYAPSSAHLDKSGLVELALLVDASAKIEAQRVASIAHSAVEQNPDQSVAILLRSRTQAASIFEALQEFGVAYQSIDMELLGERAVVKDIIALCLALRFPHDRLHWLSLLRAPFVGLTLADLHVLMSESDQRSVFSLMEEEARQAALSAEGLHRVQRLLQVITPAVKRAPRAAIMPWVESVWLQLGGPTVCENGIDLDAASRCIATLQKLETQGQLWQVGDIYEAVSSMFALSDSVEGAQVQVMTLHKSKGLEFDTVILPALDRRPRGDQQGLLNWFEAGRDEQTQLLLAPITERGVARDKADRINSLVLEARKRAESQEKLRLLYVACTRAKRRLYLLAQAKLNKDEELAQPTSVSLLHPLWPLFTSDPSVIENYAAIDVADDDVAEEAVSDTEAAGPENSPAPPLQRLKNDWSLPAFDTYNWPETAITEPPETYDDVEFKWASTTARDIGTLVHNHLQRLHDVPESEYQHWLSDLKPRLSLQLSNLGVPASQLDDAVKKAYQALENTLSDSRGLWIMSDEHAQIRSEMDITAYTATGIQRIVIDRTFIDKNDDRWIIDFKTGDHKGSDKEAFLDSEQERYQDQLRRYADIMQLVEHRPIRLGLYFPLLKAWREVTNSPEVSSDAAAPAADNTPPVQAEMPFDE